MPASGPRSRSARAHPPPHQGCPALPRRSANSGLVLATQKRGSITGRGTDANPRLPRAPRQRTAEAVARRPLQSGQPQRGRDRRRARFRRQGDRVGGREVRRRKGARRRQAGARGTLAAAARGCARVDRRGSRLRHRALRGVRPLRRRRVRPLGPAPGGPELGPHRPRPGGRHPDRQAPGARRLGPRGRRLALGAAPRTDPRRNLRSPGDRRGCRGRRGRGPVRGLFDGSDHDRAGTRQERGAVDRGCRRDRGRRPRARRAGELQARRGAGAGARRCCRGDACRRRRRLVPLLDAGRSDGQDGFAEALYRVRDLRGDPAQGRDAVLRRHRRYQQGPERPDLRVLGPRRRRRPERDRSEADRARPPAQVVRPAEYAPPFDPRDYVAPPTDAAEERIDVGILIVGAGPAGLACAIRLGQLLEGSPETAERLGEVPVAVVEKGKAPGSHLLSGAVVNPRALRRLFRDRLTMNEVPSYGEVHGEAVYLLSKGGALRIPPPPTMRNHGNYAVSVSQLGRFLAEQAEAAGAAVLPETDAQKLLLADGRVQGIRTGDKGLGRDGRPVGAYEPGADIAAKVTVLAEGTQGHLTGAAIDRFGLSGEQPQIWALGVKEVWKVAKPLRHIVHTMGWPLRKRAKYGEFGGSFIYPMGHDMVSLGFVAGLEHRDVEFSVHDVLQELKTHKVVRKILRDGERIAWGAKTITEGGYHSLPRRFHAPGLLLVGEGAGLVNVPTLKGIHYAIESGIMAAEAAFRSLQRGESPARPGAFDAYDEELRSSYVVNDLFEVRNMRQAFDKGFFVGGGLASAMTVTKGKLPPFDLLSEPNAERSLIRTGRASRYPKPDGKLTFDKLSSVFLSGNRTRDDQPDHIRIQRTVPKELADLWARMCPAQVYEVGADAGDGRVHVDVTPSNCVQCGAISAKGGRLTPPEGGSGPEYT